LSRKRSVAGATEQQVYGRLGLPYIAPELREDRGEVVLAQKNMLPKLLQFADIRGDLHVHTNWTDGTASIEEMVRAAKAKGYAYVAITDHSRHVTVAHGMDAARLLKQLDEIERINEKVSGINVLKGIELDILADGKLDLPDKVLSRLDLVIAAVHYKFDMSRAAQTDRIIRAMDNSHVSIIAHPTGRLIGERDAYAINVERLIEAAHERGCALELNAQPERLDLSDIHVQAAKAGGVKIAISTDAHAPAALDFMRYGVDQARRGWLEADDVINTRPLDKLKKLLKR